MTTNRQKRARARATRKKKQRQAKALAKQHAQKQHADKMDQLQQSLLDLLPEGARFRIDPDGKIHIEAKALRGKEDELVGHIAERLNVPRADVSRIDG